MSHVSLAADANSAQFDRFPFISAAVNKHPYGIHSIFVGKEYL